MQGTSDRAADSPTTERQIRIRYLVQTAGVLALGAVLSVVISTAVAARAYQQRGQAAVESGQTLTVKGSTRQRIRSDQAVWRIQVTAEGEVLQETYGQLEAAVDEVAEFLGQCGFHDDEVGLSAIRTTTHHRRDAKGNITRDVSGFTLGRTFAVTSQLVQRVDHAAARVTELLERGVRVISNPPEYYYTGLADLKLDLMAAASNDARARAEKIASASGCRVGAVRTARMGVLQVTRPFSTEVSSYGMYDTSTIDKDVRAVVTITFGVGT